MSDPFGALERVPATDAVVRRIESLIVQNKLAPGDSLPPERELASRLEVSRNILREALRTLSQKGLVRVVAGRGTFVDVPSPRVMTEFLQLLLQMRQIDLVELADARLLIEPQLAALAAERATDSDIASMKKLVDRMREVEADDMAHVQDDLEFHAAVATAARHSVLQAMVEAVSKPVTLGMRIGMHVPLATSVSDRYHQSIFEAIQARDGDAAKAAMTGHLLHVQDYLRGLGRRPAAPG